MELQGHKISNLGKFRSYFCLEEVVGKLDILVKDFRNIFYEEKKDQDCFEFIRRCAGQREPARLFLVGEVNEDELCSYTREDEVWLYLQPGKEDRLKIGDKGWLQIFLQFQDRENLERILRTPFAMEQPWLAAQLIAVCELARFSCPVDYFAKADPVGGGGAYRAFGNDGKGQQGEQRLSGSEKEPQVDFDQTVAQAEFKLWDPDQDPMADIVTKKLTRETYTKYSSGAEIVVRDSRGEKVVRIQKRLVHELYGNFIGGCLVELLPEESVCGDFRVYKEWQDDGRMVLKREKGKTALPPYQGDVEAFSRMSCFAATEDDGLLGIKEGKVFACTSLVKPARLWGEKAVYVCEVKGLYAILTEKGRLVTNVEFHGGKVCMVRMDRQGNVYALQRDGRVATSNPDMQDELAKYEKIVQLWCEPDQARLILRDAQGEEFAVEIREGNVGCLNH